MDEIFFPQLSAGTLAQYPLRRTHICRTIKNVLADGRLILSPDPSARKLQWSLTYSNISTAELQALQSHFRLCNGPFRSFTFLDPAANLLSWSSDLKNPVWLQQNQIQVEAGVGDPSGGQNAFRLTNIGQAEASFCQTITAPSYFVYCFSSYVRSGSASTANLLIKGAQSVHAQALYCDSTWRRVTAKSTFQEQSYELSSGILLAPGQAIEIFGPQLEAQSAPSGYRATAAKSGIYQSAHYAANELIVTAEAPGAYSSVVVIESVE